MQKNCFRQNGELWIVPRFRELVSSVAPEGQAPLPVPFPGPAAKQAAQSCTACCQQLEEWLSCSRAGWLMRGWMLHSCVPLQLCPEQPGPLSCPHASPSLPSELGTDDTKASKTPEASRRLSETTQLGGLRRVRGKRESPRCLSWCKAHCDERAAGPLPRAVLNLGVC